jgi:hypothetical protein
MGEKQAPPPSAGEYNQFVFHSRIALFQFCSGHSAHLQPDIPSHLRASPYMSWFLESLCKEPSITRQTGWIGLVAKLLQPRNMSAKKTAVTRPGKTLNLSLNNPRWLRHKPACPNEMQPR